MGSANYWGTHPKDVTRRKVDTQHREAICPREDTHSKEDTRLKYEDGNQKCMEVGIEGVLI